VPADWPLATACTGDGLVQGREKVVLARIIVFSVLGPSESWHLPPSGVSAFASRLARPSRAVS